MVIVEIRRKPVEETETTWPEKRERKQECIAKSLEHVKEGSNQLCQIPMKTKQQSLDWATQGSVMLLILFHWRGGARV